MDRSIYEEQLLQCKGEKKQNKKVQFMLLSWRAVGPSYTYIYIYIYVCVTQLQRGRAFSLNSEDGNHRESVNMSCLS